MTMRAVEEEVKQESCLLFRLFLFVLMFAATSQVTCSQNRNSLAVKYTVLLEKKKMKKTERQ